MHNSHISYMDGHFRYATPYKLHGRAFQTFLVKSHAMIEWVVVVNIINVSDDKDLPAQVFMDGLWSQHPVS